ncbi:MAG: NUDIX hydrolase [Proteobacteria bacterium]|nr:NUDIX hydrolase [Pseudomonadota bacterium]
MARPTTPLLTVDVIIRIPDNDGSVVLVERKHEPFGWALPGGFVDIGETVEQAALREAKEETGLIVTLDYLLGVYSDPDRDPRGHTVSVVFVGHSHGEPRGGDDAHRAQVFDITALPRLVFDHARILDDYCNGQLS